MSYIIDGLTYTDKLPHSRIERLLYEILKRQEGGGVGKTIVVDDPSDVGDGLQVQGNFLTIDADTTVTLDSYMPVTSGAVADQLNIVDEIMTMI